MTLPAVLASGPIRLERVDPSATAAICAAITASLPELARWFPWAQAPPVLAEMTARLTEKRDAYDAGTDHELSLWEVATGELVGGARLDPAYGPGAAGIGYWVRSDRHRRGYATAAAGALTEAAFAHLDIDELVISMDEANVASAGVPPKLGYVCTGTFADGIVAPGRTGTAQRWVRHR